MGILIGVQTSPPIRGPAGTRNSGSLIACPLETEVGQSCRSGGVNDCHVTLENQKKICERVTHLPELQNVDMEVAVSWKPPLSHCVKEEGTAPTHSGDVHEQVKD